MAPGGEEPLPEGLLWLLLTGKVPTESQVQALSKDLESRAALPPHLSDTLAALPGNTHPMTQFSIGIMALQPDSKFAQAYQTGAPHGRAAPHLGRCHPGARTARELSLRRGVRVGSRLRWSVSPCFAVQFDIAADGCGGSRGSQNDMQDVLLAQERHFCSSWVDQPHTAHVEVCRPHSLQL